MPSTAEDRLKIVDKFCNLKSSLLYYVCCQRNGLVLVDRDKNCSKSESSEKRASNYMRSGLIGSIGSLGLLREMIPLTGLS